MKKYYMLVMFLVLALSACNTSGESEAEGNDNAEGSNDSSNLTITTGAQGGSWYPIGGALAELMNQNTDNNFSSVPGGGTSNPQSVANGNADIGFSYNSTLLSAEEGTDPFNEPQEGLKAVAKVYDMAWHVITPENSGIESFEDIVQQEIGVNWSPNNRGTGDEWITSKVIEEYGFSYEDIESWGGGMNFVSISDGLSLWRDNHVNLYSAHTLPPQASFIEATMARDSKFLSVDEEVIESLNEKYGLVEAVIPAGTYEGQDEDVTTVTMPMVIFTREDVDEEVIYELTKALDEEQEHLQTVHQVFESFDIETAHEDTGIELHEGAKKYYEEIGALD